MNLKRWMRNPKKVNMQSLYRRKILKRRCRYDFCNFRMRRMNSVVKIRVGVKAKDRRNHSRIKEISKSQRNKQNRMIPKKNK